MRFRKWSSHGRDDVLRESRTSVVMRTISVVHRTSERYDASPGAVVGAVWSALPGALPELNAYPAERKLRLGRIYDCGMSPRAGSFTGLPMNAAVSRLIGRIAA